MRMIKAVQACAAVSAISLGAFVASPVPAAAAEPQIAGYCLYFHENSIYYRSPVFRAAKDKRSRWKTDWANHLYKQGVKYYGGYGCRAWDGGADAVASAAEAAAKPPMYTQRIVEMDWIPEDSVRAFGGGNATLPRSTSRETTAPTNTPSAKVAPVKVAPAPSKYVEVAGPNGVIRLSPEVVARNQAAADEYRRKMDAFARAKAEHERKLALHQQSIANAATEKREYQRKLAAHGEQVASSQKSGTGGRHQATSTMRDTRDAALAMLMSFNLPGELTDIKCDTINVGGKVKWSCWGYYYYTPKGGSVSAQ